jgi:diaminopimelate decarboxylase
MLPTVLRMREHYIPIWKICLSSGKKTVIIASPTCNSSDLYFRELEQVELYLHNPIGLQGAYVFTSK